MRRKQNCLTRNECYFLGFLCAGLTSREISIVMLVSARTVERLTLKLYRCAAQWRKTGFPPFPRIDPFAARLLLALRRPMAIRKGIIQEAIQ
jgi:hypothetical protein